MPFTDKPQVFGASINALTIGTEGRSTTIGGSNVYPLYSFDAALPNSVKVGIEISNKGYDATIPGFAALYEGTETVADRAVRAAACEGVDFVAVNLEGADPNGDDMSVEDCAAQVKAVYDAIDKPIVVMGCKNTEKDTALFNKVAEVMQGCNIVLMSAKEEDYKTIGASAGLAYGQIIGAESAVDINLAKQLNVLFSQLGVDSKKVVMNVGSAAAGYGFEYLASTLDRIKNAALTQNDAMLQMPIITPVAGDAWGVKEALLEEADMPEWGSREERGIQMEIVTASACIASGSDAVILRHPESVKTISELASGLM